jgi:hypothetical protein
MPITPEITVAIQAGVPHSKLHQMAMNAGMLALSCAGYFGSTRWPQRHHLTFIADVDTQRGRSLA